MTDFDHWNYRVLERPLCSHDGIVDVEFHIIECHYDESEVIHAWTAGPQCPIGDTPGELRECLQDMLTAAGDAISGWAPVLHLADLPSG